MPDDINNDDPFVEIEDLSPLIEKRNRFQLALIMSGKAFLLYFLPLAVIVASVLIYFQVKEEDNGALIVVSHPDSSMIILNGSVIIQRAGEVVAGLKPGNITVSAYLPGYICQPEEFLGVIAVDETLKIEFTLFPAPDTLPDTVPSDTTPALDPVLTQEYTPGKSTHLRYFPPANRQRELRSIIVTSDIKGAVILVNGVNSGLVTNSSLDSLPLGSLTVSLVKEGFMVTPKSKTVILDREYQTELIHFHLASASKQINPELMIATEPVDGKIFLNDSLAASGTFKSRLPLGKYQIRFGEVKNFLTPNPMIISLTENDPIQMIKVEYIRIIGKSAIALVRLPENGIIEGNKLHFNLDQRPYFTPSKGHRNGYLIDNLPPGKHLLRFDYEGMTLEREIECRDGEVVELSFLLERVLNKKSLKIRSLETLPRSDWLKLNAALDMEIVQNPNR